MNGGTGTTVMPATNVDTANVTSAVRPTPPAIERVDGFEQADRDALLRFLDALDAAECPVMPESVWWRAYNDRPDSTAFDRARLREQHAKQVA